MDMSVLPPEKLTPLNLTIDIKRLVDVYVNENKFAVRLKVRFIVKFLVPHLSYLTFLYQIFITHISCRITTVIRVWILRIQ